MVAGLVWWAAEASYRGDGQAGQEREEDGGGGMEKMQRGGSSAGSSWRRMRGSWAPRDGCRD